MLRNFFGAVLSIGFVLAVAYCGAMDFQCNAKHLTTGVCSRPFAHH